VNKFRLALDWTANSNHIGFYVALEKGFYRDLELEVELLTPDQDDYQLTPAKKVELGIADLALCPMESILSYRTKANPFPLLAIAAVLQEDLSAIVSLADKGFESPKALDQKSYASYKARYEDEIVRKMIQNDGGSGEIELLYPDKLGIWNTLVEGKADSTWIFMNWEGLQAKAKGIELTHFRLKDYGIPYSYSPVIVVNEASLEAMNSQYRSFLAASRKGFVFAQNNPKEATEILFPHIDADYREMDLEASVRMTTAAMGSQADWGKMDYKNIQEYLDWLQSSGLLPEKFEPEQLAINSLL
jgi:ABC-type nitrate/sulfonate/bicarbonate transport system substrate-binding protein